ncbi:hypothetical protein LDENG_00079930 [Lucifuga dentata]|nr:hypothetical protein LDENG_00079930 [Lucifuga dentata]
MDVKMLSSIDEELDSSEVAALCFLCLDVLNRKRLETVKDGKELFQRLEEKGLLENNSFLSQLLRTIRRADLLNLLETDSRRPEESFDPQTDAAPVLSDYRVMLYEIYEDLTQENLEKMKFFLTSKLGKRQMENCKTALDVFAEMEKTGYLSNTDLDELHSVLNECDRQLALTVQEYRNGASFLQYQPGSPPLVSMDNQLNSRPPQQASVSVTETQPNLDERQSLFFDTQPNTESSLPRDPVTLHMSTNNAHSS